MASSKRKPHPDLKISSAEILNSMSQASAERMYQECSVGAAQDGNCLFPDVKIKNGEYPRKSLSKVSCNKYIIDKDVKTRCHEVLAHPNGKIRLPYHLIAWRAQGKTVPDFESGVDISHHCKKGQMRAAAAKASARCRDVGNGCFSKLCLEESSHAENLARGACDPIHQCPHCELFFSDCKHVPTCGTDRALEEAMEEQPPIASITIEFADGTTRKVVFAASEE